jgi:hypothetical protein
VLESIVEIVFCRCDSEHNLSTGNILISDEIIDKFKHAFPYNSSWHLFVNIIAELQHDIIHTGQFVVFEGHVRALPQGEISMNF